MVKEIIVGNSLVQERLDLPERGGNLRLELEVGGVAECMTQQT